MRVITGGGGREHDGGDRYRRFGNDSDVGACYVKRRTDPLGGMKVLLGGGGSLNPHGYAEAGRVADLPPPAGSLPGMPRDAWRRFWADMSDAEERGDAATVWLLLLGFLSFALTMPALILSHSTCAWAAPALALLIACGVECRTRDKVARWKQVIDAHQPEFQQLGYGVAFLVEANGPTGYRGYTTHSNVCHFWPLPEEGHGNTGLA